MWVGSCISAILPLVSLANGAAIGGKHGLGLRKYSSTVIFGNSYTDWGLRNYEPDENGNVGQPTTNASTGGRVWPHYVQQYTGTRMYNYAVSGAVCSYPFAPGRRNGVQEDQVPTFLSNKAYVNATTGKPILNIPRDETVYAVWIGTNDLGNRAFGGDQQPRGLPVTAYIDCVFDQLDTLYESGARHFVLLNIAPLNFSPQWALPENGGVDTSPFFPDKITYNPNITQTSEKIRHTISLVNSVYQYKIPYEVQLTNRYRGSSFAIYDTNSLMSDIWHNPESYLNGTVPFDVTSSIRQCGAACSASDVRDSYMWYDELHPSEQTDRILAREFIKVVQGGSKWATYFK